MPQSVLNYVLPDHLAHFVRDTMSESLDPGEILETYAGERGYPPYQPTMMTALLLCAYCQGSTPRSERLRAAWSGSVSWR